ncbi:MAG: ribosome-associated translation inhibitor RaiA [Nitrospinota bacterium]|nr:ribosome-associated translation inhibitor RaiA [Nitrospinota bacterium]MDH5677040.1 ribosome-associated translation inhibitor RaiA [Nitrospinota bacterium]MDH5755065.1 ribosome-associated translation inhibitor RaiA [Nitrospinota bacterium]
MQITITGHHVEVTPAIRQYAEEKVAKVRKYLNTTINAHVTLKVEKLLHIAEVTIHANGVDLHGMEKTDNLYAAIDKVMDKIDRQAKKVKGKIQDKRKDVTQVIAGSED